MPTQLARQTKRVMKGEAGDEGPGCLWPLGAPSPREGEIPAAAGHGGEDGACLPWTICCCLQRTLNLMVSPSGSSSASPQQHLAQGPASTNREFWFASHLCDCSLPAIRVPEDSSSPGSFCSCMTCPPSSSTPTTLRLLSRSILLEGLTCLLSATFIFPPASSTYAHGFHQLTGLTCQLQVIFANKLAARVILLKCKLGHSQSCVQEHLLAP